MTTGYDHAQLALSKIQLRKMTMNQTPFDCDGCGNVHEGYMVSDDVWQREAKLSKSAKVCVRCLQSLIKRQLTILDFPAAVINEHIFRAFLWGRAALAEELLEDRAALNRAIADDDPEPALTLAWDRVNAAMLGASQLALTLDDTLSGSSTRRPPGER